MLRVPALSALVFRWHPSIQGASSLEPVGEISDIASLVSILKEHKLVSEHWYRGHENVDWKLLPRLDREADGLNREIDVIARFKQNASLLLQPLPTSEWEWLTVMQHYRAPTRLLDWTESPLVALYFAVEQINEEDGALWMLDPVSLNRASRLSFRYERYIPSFDDEVIQNYLPSVLQQDRGSAWDPVAFIGPRNTPRMQAQLGVFTVIHRDAIPVECVGNQEHVRKFRIPGNAKCALRSELALLATNKFQLFPDLQSLGESLGVDQNV